MFAIFKYIFYIAITMFIFGCSYTSAAKNLQSSNFGTCNAEGECTADLPLDSSASKNLCGNQKTNVFWSNNIKNYVVVQCDCQCSSHDNEGWVIKTFDSAQKIKTTHVQLGKAVSKTFILRSPTSVPDIMTSHSFCKAPDKKRLAESFFVTLFKYPTGNDDFPYCFSAISFKWLGENLVIETDDGPVDKNNDDFFLKTGDENRKELSEIVSKVEISRQSTK